MDTENTAIEATKVIIEKGKNYLSMIFNVPVDEIYLEELEINASSKWKITFSFYETIPSKARSVTRNPLLDALKPFGDIQPIPNYRKVYKIIEIKGLDSIPTIKNYSQ